MAALMPLLPKTHQPLVQALIEESDELRQRVRQRTRQSAAFLSQSFRAHHQAQEAGQTKAVTHTRA